MTKILPILVLSILFSAGSYAERNEPIRPLKSLDNISQGRATLGALLFSDKRLSRDNTISCASCHHLPGPGVDGMPRSVGVDGQHGSINSPTVYNSVFNFRQFWDGRAHDLEDQAGMPIANPVEMDSNLDQVMTKLSTDSDLVDRFKANYDDGLTAANILNAIAEFEKTLVTVNSPFDRWLAGDDRALSADALEGYKLFKSYGCVSCHQGQNVGGNMYARMGAMVDYFSSLKRPLTSADLGLYNVTKKEHDKHLFKVPSLRLASLTPPYFHDASADNLVSAIKVMALHQLGRFISDSESEQIEAFIRSLKGEHPLLEGDSK